MALGNSGNPAATGPLTAALREHDEALVRVHCAWALARLGGPSVRSELAAAAAREPVPGRVEAARALGRLGARAVPAVPSLLELVPGDDPDLNSAVVVALGRIGPYARGQGRRIREAMIGVVLNDPGTPRFLS